MTVDEVMRYRRAKPFEPFVVKLHDGREFSVFEPEQIGRDEAFTQISVSADEDSVETFYSSEIAEIRVLPASAAYRDRKGE